MKEVLSREVLSREVLSDADLVSCLEHIKTEIQSVDSLDNGRVIFLNLDSFFAYIDNVSLANCGGGSGLKHLISVIEPYIPITVPEKYLELFMTAVDRRNTVFAEDIEVFLGKYIKINFINQIYRARTPDAWENLLRTCRAVRDMYADEETRKTLASAYFSELFQ